MNLKLYEWHGSLWQFEEGKQPVDAIERKQKQVANKSKTAANKAKSESKSR